VIYSDTSVALAHLLAEDRAPPERLWQEELISSRLLEYEIWTRIHALKLAHTHADDVRSLLKPGRTGRTLAAGARQSFGAFSEASPHPRRPPFASIEFLRTQGQRISVAVYDGRLLDAARALRIPIYKL